MARPREFDREAALQRAIDMFRLKGYEGTSMKDLLDTMEIGRQSLYDTFGDKHALFLECLKHYSMKGRELSLGPLRAVDGGLKAIEHYFKKTATMMCKVPHRSCLVINTAVELSEPDSEEGHIVNQFILQLHGAFSEALRVAKNKGEASYTDLDATAWNFTNSAMGFGPMSRAGIPAAALQSAADQLIASIKTH